MLREFLRIDFVSLMRSLSNFMVFETKKGAA